MRNFLLHGVPATSWVMVLYALVVYGDRLFFSGLFLDTQIFAIPTLSAASIVVTGAWLFVILAFVALAIESIRATRVRGNTANDYMSVVTLIVGLVLLIGVDAFGTMAFAVLFVAEVIDVLQDRIVGQAVARRDWGVQLPTTDNT